ncbi:hypothetical protein KR018_008827, partial [Drosophila ironensis]
MQRALHDLATFHIEAENEERLYASSAVSSFSLIRHMQSDWTHWQIYLQEEPGEDELEFLKKSKPLLPSKKDLNKASEEVFKMKNFRWVSIGCLKLIKIIILHSSLASPRDCIHLANLKINSKDFSTAEQLLRKALALLENPTYQEKIGINVADIYTRLAHVLLVQDKPEVALATFETALQHFPHNASLFQEYQNLKKKVLIEPKIFQTNSSDLDDTVYDMECCNGLCKTARNLQLYCVYDSKTSPFLRLAAVKKEFLSLDPYIVIFHNVISEKEILRIRRASKDQLTVSTIMNYDSGEHVVDSYRTSKSVWYPSDTNDLTWRLTNLVGDVSGMEMKTSERFQVINYGIAGIFEAHTDSLLLDHLSEVPQGGATVFTKLNLTVFPQPGSAIFWYNLDNQGNEDKRTDHAGCPVIVGSKWIMTKWVSHFGQEFRKPCYKLDYPIPFY